MNVLPIQRSISFEEQQDIRRKLNLYNSKINLMSILCDKASVYNVKIKNIITILLILMSCSSAIIMGIVNDNEKIIKIPIIILNSVTTLLLAFERTYKFGEKASNFQKYSQSYSKLSHKIDQNKVINLDFLALIISMYDNITDGINEPFPTNIINSMKNEYKDIDNHHKPLILQGHFTPVESFKFSNILAGRSPIMAIKKQVKSEIVSTVST